MSKSSRYHGNQRKLAAAAICGSFVLGGTRARGDLVWDFSYVGTFPDYGPHYGTQDTASGELITTDLNNSNNTYTIVGISGTDDGLTISALIAPVDTAATTTCCMHRRPILTLTASRSPPEATTWSYITMPQIATTGTGTTTAVPRKARMASSR